MKSSIILEVLEAKAVIEELEKTGNQLAADVCRLMAICVLRVGDAVSLRYSDIQRGVLSIREQKTGKLKEIELPSSAMTVIQRRRAMHPKDVFIFTAHGNRASGNKAVSREYISRAISKAAKAVGIKGTVSSHSFRKYGVASVYKATGNDLAQTAALLNHSNFDVTRRYLRLDAATAGEAVGKIEI